ncbi:MAG: uracil phosphoribosyltransferase [Proteobacteria bacterium]|nr:uracil phosphoribosyltransferase [Pseudomonadota bacterium]NDC24088.1 uracil phosphoribosyltransferase [Pseudomonadota bacterium]NDD03511.1 uracil phosphoribosyltransferase [Pseudomonadota bacterium]NDG27383.1 uracil phosphoribosyltransferase [Pseudomonadota bacterium]
MLHDNQYLNRNFKLSEIEHHYGPHFHILSDPYLFTTLARLGRPDCKQPMVNSLLSTLYREMVNVIVNQEFPLIETEIETRMKSLHPQGQFKTLIVDPNTKVSCVSLARAGILPSQTCFDAFNYFLNPDGVRQDHISINRKIDEQEHVVGTQLGGLKIGGDVQDRFVVIPDPMGATGSTIGSVLEIYRKLGKAKRYIAVHLIITPEYLKLMKTKYPEVIVYALRLDRGLSSDKVLTSVPGTFWDEEKGLNNHQYIVPGAGGLGEVINNSYV